MATALNLALPLKQDAESQAKLARLKEGFAQGPQKAIDAAFNKSQIVHFARFLVIDNRYLLILTEYDGDVAEYSEFFRQELRGVFGEVFSLVEGVPLSELNDPTTFFEVAKKFDVRAMGDSVDGDPGQGYLYSAFGKATVREINKALGNNAPALW